MNGWMLKSCFWLLALVIGSAMLLSVVTGFGCIYLVLIGTNEIGACVKVGIATQIRELLSEVLAVVLALLLAARGPPGGDANE